MKKLMKLIIIIVSILFLCVSNTDNNIIYANSEIKTNTIQENQNQKYFNIFDSTNCTINGNEVTIEQPIKIDGNNFTNKTYEFIFPKNYVFKVSDNFPIGQPVLEFYNFDNLSISDLNIDGKLKKVGNDFYNGSILLNTSGDWESLNQAIWIRDSKSATLNNVKSTNSTGCGIATKSVDNVSITDCIVKNSYQHGIFVGSAKEKVLIDNCNCTAFGDLGYETNIKVGGIGILVSESENPTISNCIINGFPDTGTKTEGCNHVRYISNTVKNFGKDGIKVQGYEDKVVNVSDCIVQNNNVNTRFNGRPDGSSYILFHDVTNGIIEGNTITKDVENDTTCDDGIRVNMLNGTKTSDIQILNNIIEVKTESPSLNIMGNDKSDVEKVTVIGNTFRKHIICDKVNDININNNILEGLTSEDDKYKIYAINASKVNIFHNSIEGKYDKSNAIYVQKDSCKSVTIDNVLIKE